MALFLGTPPFSICFYHSQCPPKAALLQVSSSASSSWRCRGWEVWQQQLGGARKRKEDGIRKFEVEIENKLCENLNANLYCTAEMHYVRLLTQKRIMRTGGDHLHIVVAVQSSAGSAELSEAGQLEHSQILETFFDDTGELFEIKNERPDWLKKVIAAGLVEKGSTVLVGPGSTSLIPLLRNQGVNIVVAHWSLFELASVKGRFDEVRCWHGNIEKIPHSWGTYDAVFLGHAPAMAFSAVSLLKGVISRCRAGARVVINQCQGKEYLAPFREMYPHILLRDLPELNDLQSMITNQPLEFVSFENELSTYLVSLEVTESLDKPEADIDMEDVGEFPLYAKATVMTGFGRGSKKMGIPTANLNPEELPQEIVDLPKGVYFGWVQVRATGVDRGVHKMVMNIGQRPTFSDSDAITVEVHILHDYEGVDFYGQEAVIVVLGFIRQEQKFSSLDALVGQIHEDIETTKTCLEEEVLKSYQTDGYFRI